MIELGRPGLDHRRGAARPHPVLTATRSGTALEDVRGQSPADQPRRPDAMVARLTAQFPDLEPYAVQNCVRDTVNCAEHLGVSVTPEVVERMAREHLATLAGPGLRPPEPRRPTP